MSIATQIQDAIGEQVTSVFIDKNAIVNGESATWVKVGLSNGKFVEGTFTTEAKSGFGGVEFEHKKNVAELMVSKIRSVLRGSAE